MGAEVLLFAGPAVAATAVSVAKAVAEFLIARRGSQAVKVAEAQAFRSQAQPEELQKRIAALASSQESLEQKAQDLAKLVAESADATKFGNLFNLYNSQIEQYHQQTKSRAAWSFYIALIAMFFGLAFVAWGGYHILADGEPKHVAAGSAVAAIGGAVSSFLTATFLKVHQMSIDQLNSYFVQPVINDHILMAQRIANEMSDPKAKQKSYEMIIGSINELIRGHIGDERHRDAASRGRPKKAYKKADDGAATD